MSMSDEDFDENMPPELRALLEQKRAELFVHNNAPLEEFAGLTASQMYELIYSPWESASPIKSQDATQDLLDASIFSQAMLIALEYFSSEKGEKLTPQGRWPRKLLLKICQLGDADLRFFDRTPRLEEDWPIANALHVILLHGGLLRKSKGNMFTTKQGKLLLTIPASACEWFELEFTQSFNWSYLDRFPEVPRYQQHWGFLVWLLLRFGRDEKPLKFYSDYFIKAWPMFLAELPEDRYARSVAEQFHHIFALRFIQRGFAWLGWVEYKHEGKGFDAEIFVKATPAFFQRWKMALM